MIWLSRVFAHLHVVGAQGGRGERGRDDVGWTWYSSAKLGIWEGDRNRPAEDMEKKCERTRSMLAPSQLLQNAGLTQIIQDVFRGDGRNYNRIFNSIPQAKTQLRYNT